MQLGGRRLGQQQEGRKRHRQGLPVRGERHALAWPVQVATAMVGEVRKSSRMEVPAGLTAIPGRHHEHDENHITDYTTTNKTTRSLE